MLSLLFGIFMIMVFGKMILLAIRAAWGITKVLFTIVFFPLILVGLFMSGLVYVAFIGLIIAGVLALLGN